MSGNPRQMQSLIYYSRNGMLLILAFYRQCSISFSLQPQSAAFLTDISRLILELRGKLVSIV